MGPISLFSLRRPLTIHRKAAFRFLYITSKGMTWQSWLTKIVLNSLYSSDEFEEPRIHISNLSNEILSLSDTLQDGYFEVNLQTGEFIQTDDLGTPVANP